MHFIAAAFLLLTIDPHIAVAAQGACSWHDGVDCSAGADWDGSVVCEDGWRDSTVKYSDMKTCKKQCPWGYTEEFFSKLLDCTHRMTVTDPELQNQLNQLRNQAEYYRTEAYKAVTYTPDEWQDLMPEAQRRLRNQRVQDLSFLFGETTAKISDIKDEIESKKQQAERDCDLLDSTANFYCKPFVQIEKVCPLNAKISNDNCVCDNGYEWNETASHCVVKTKLLLEIPKPVNETDNGIKKKTEKAIVQKQTTQQIPAKQAVQSNHTLEVKKLQDETTFQTEASYTEQTNAEDAVVPENSVVSEEKTIFARMTGSIRSFFRKLKFWGRN